MPAPTVMIHYANIAQMKARLQHHQAQVRALHMRLQSQIEVLKRGAWVSETAQKFYQDMALTLEGVARLQNALGQAAGTFNTIAHTFLQAEQDGADGLPSTQDELSNMGSIRASSIVSTTASTTPFSSAGVGENHSVPAAARMMEAMNVLPLSNNLLNATDQAMLDSIDDAVAQDQMRLQMMMERRAKMFEMLSNLIKAQQETQQSIIRNMK